MFFLRVIDVQVIDADTLLVMLDLGLKIQSQQHLRVRGVDTPERHSQDLLERKAAIHATAMLDRWLADWHRDGELLFVRSDERPDKFGRLLGDLVACSIKPSGIQVLRTLSELIIQSGIGRVYSGEKKQPWTAAQLKQICDCP